MVPQVRVPGFWTVPGRRAEALSLGIVATVEHAGISRPWAVLSEVTDSNGERAHLPMLDLRCEHSAANLLSVQRIAEHLLECPWVIIQSNSVLSHCRCHVIRRGRVNSVLREVHTLWSNCGQTLRGASTDQWHRRIKDSWRIGTLRQAIDNVTGCLGVRRMWRRSGPAFRPSHR